VVTNARGNAVEPVENQWRVSGITDMLPGG
jgi:hypothetical protein